MSPGSNYAVTPSGRETQKRKPVCGFGGKHYMSSRMVQDNKVQAHHLDHLKDMMTKKEQ